jgi:pilus assembly protein CpaF
MRVIDRIVSAVGRRVDDSSPMVDARLPDGSRVNAIIPPLAVDGPLLSIRRFPAERLRADDLVTLRALTRPMLEFLSHCVKARLNALISGGTGAGKTTLLNVLSSFISERERIVTIEDAAELQLHQEHVVRLETRPANVEGKGAIRQRQLMVNALRMRPDRIVVGEVRSEEALDMLQAMNTGHDGSLTTVHANTPRDALTRIETMIAMGATNLPERAMRQQISSAIQFVVQQTRLSDGSRKISSISEITGMEGDVITMQEIFVFEKMGLTQDGKVIGRFRATGVPFERAARFAGKTHYNYLKLVKLAIDSLTFDQQTGIIANLVKTLAAEKGRDLLKQVRTQLIEGSWPVLEALYANFGLVYLAIVPL